MNVNCPHCGKQLQMSAKVEEKLQRLEGGKKLKVKCVHCGDTFGLDGKAGQPQPPPGKRGLGPLASRPLRPVSPPDSPDVSWLKEGIFDDQEVIEDIPKALVLMPEIESKAGVIKSVTDLAYQVEQASTPEEAVEKMRFVNYTAVFLHTQFEPVPVNSGVFHGYMRGMSMSRRRDIFYVLMGREFKTLYDLQALAYSANVVVHDNEVSYIGTILKKTIPEYEELFGPIMEELRTAGK